MSPILCQDRSKELKREKYAVIEKGGGELSCLCGWDRYGEVLRTSSASQEEWKTKTESCLIFGRGGLL